MREEKSNGGKYPDSADTSPALSEFADDTASSSRSTSVPPAAPAMPTANALRVGSERLTTFVRDNPGMTAAVGGLLLGFVVGIYAFSRRR